MDFYGRGRRGCIHCNFGVVPPSSLSLTVRHYDVTLRLNQSCTRCGKADTGQSRLGGRDEPVDDGSPRQWLDPADAQQRRVHRPPMSTLDPFLPMTTGSFGDVNQRYLSLCLSAGDKRDHYNQARKSYRKFQSACRVNPLLPEFDTYPSQCRLQTEYCGNR
jgi:hypothetical protein